MNYDYLIYIGRFQPLHLGHQSIIDIALKHAKHVIMLVGSANRPRSISNPWTFDERKSMIHNAYPNNHGVNLTVLPLDDIDYNDSQWLGLVQTTLKYIPKDATVGLIGFEKDSSSFYLRLFPQWKKFKIKEQWGTVSATDIRNNYFHRMPILPHNVCSDAVLSYMNKFMLTSAFKYILSERQSIDTIKSKWKDSPYPPHFIAADAVVTQAGHILLVERGEAPGKGLLALPGGHIDVNAGDSFENCIKELHEEAQPMDSIAEKHDGPMPRNRLKGFYTGYEQRFDSPDRDPRGYYLTTAFRFVFPGGRLWSVRGGDDAAYAGWYPIGNLDPTKMFADHYFIIQQMLDKTGGR